MIPGVEESGFSLGICGTGGGDGKGEEDEGDGGGVGGVLTVGIGIDAFFLRCCIFSLYTSFNSLTSRRPSLIHKQLAYDLTRRQPQK